MARSFGYIIKSVAVVQTIEFILFHLIASQIFFSNLKIKNCEESRMQYATVNAPTPTGQLNLYHFN